MEKNTFGLPINIFEDLIKTDPKITLDQLKTAWIFKPAAFAVGFLPGNEQKVVDYLSTGLDEYQHTQVDLGGAIRQLSSSNLTNDFYKLFFEAQIKAQIIKSDEKRVYFFSGADNLTSEEFTVLRFSNDMFERDRKVNELLKYHSIYPLVMQSLTVGQRILAAPGGNLRTLPVMFFTGYR